MTTKSTSELKEIMQKLQKQCFETFKQKNTDYGNSFAEYGVIGIFIRIQDKISRIKTLINGKTPQVKTESIQDSLLDIANYALMGLYCVEERREDIYCFMSKWKLDHEHYIWHKYIPEALLQDNDTLKCQQDNTDPNKIQTLFLADKNKMKEVLKKYNYYSLLMATFYGV